MKIQQLYVTIVLRSVLCRFSHQFSSPYVPEFVSPFFDIKILSVYWLENFFPENTLDKISKFTIQWICAAQSYIVFEFQL